MKKFFFPVLAAALVLTACGTKTTETSAEAAATETATAQQVGTGDIAYVQVEAVLAQCDLFLTEGKALQEKTEKAQKSWAQREQNLQAEAAQLQEKYQKGLITTNDAQAQQKAAAFAQGVQQMKGCGDVDGAAQAMGAHVVSNDNVRIRDLPPALQQLMLSLQIGQTTPPFGSAKDGVSVLMLCGRDEAQINDGPSFDDLMSQMEDDRVNKRAQRYLRDLRRDAVIEYN